MNKQNPISKIIEKFKPKLKPKKKKIDASIGEHADYVEEISTGSGWTDYLYYGGRRALKTLINVGGVAAGVAGIAVLKGTPIGQAATGAALIAAGSAAAMGVEKTLKERSKSKGVRWYESPDVIVAILKVIPTVLKMIMDILREIRKRKEKDDG